MEDWNQTTLGELALTEENRLLGAAVRRMHGDTLLWAGTCPTTAELSRNCMIRSRLFACAGTCEASDDMSVFRSTLEEIPLRNGCIDGVVLHHALEQCADPRAALREVARVLQPGGQLILCGLQPLRQLVPRPLAALYTGSLSESLAYGGLA